MTIIRKRKGKMLLAAAAGALGAVMICVGVFYACIRKSGVQAELLFQSGQKLFQSSVIRLTRDIGEGEVLSSGALEEVIVQVPEGKIKKQSISAYEGKCLKISMKEGSILSETVVYENEKPADDERLLNLSYVKLNDKMEQGDYVDVRISFRSGGDYVLLSKKKIQDISGNMPEDGDGLNALWLQINEEEILRLASAVVDAFYQEGCEIYAIEYVSETQKAAEVTYPVNEAVKKLLNADPNVSELAQGELPESMRVELRNALEEVVEGE